jgi:hypothetical protein
MGCDSTHIDTCSKRYTIGYPCYAVVFIIIERAILLMISGDIRVEMTVSPGSAASTHFKISDTQVSHRQEGVTVITPVTVYECRRNHHCRY